MQQTLNVENQRKISETIRKILALGLQWVEVRPKARTAINSFYDPATRLLYTTFDSGLIQRERQPSEQQKARQAQFPFMYQTYQNPVNKFTSEKSVHTWNDKEYVRITKNIVKLPTELERLERILECLTTVKNRKAKKA